MAAKMSAPRAVVALGVVIALGTTTFIWANRGGGGGQQQAQAASLVASAQTVGGAGLKVYQPKKVDIASTATKKDFKPHDALWQFSYPTIGREKRLPEVLESAAGDLVKKIEQDAIEATTEAKTSKYKVVGPPLDAELTERKITGQLVAVTKKAVVVSLRAEILKPKTYLHRYQTVYFDRETNEAQPLDKVLKNTPEWVAELDRIRKEHSRSDDLASADDLLSGLVVLAGQPAEVPLTTKTFTSREDAEGVAQFEVEGAKTAVSAWLTNATAPPKAPSAGASQAAAEPPTAQSSQPLWVAAADVKQPKPQSAYDEDGNFTGRKIRGVNCAEVKCVALTFDDGPGAATGKLLDILEEKNVPATFFPVGRMVQENPGLIERMHKQGHQLGNHTWTHPILTRLSPDKIKSEISKTADVVRTATGQEMTIYRPPYGARNAKVDQAVNLPGIMWDVDTMDWKHKNTARTTEIAIKNASAGSIVLMHDIHAPTVEAVPAIIDGLRERGFTLVTYDMLMSGKKVGSTDRVTNGPRPGQPDNS